MTRVAALIGLSLAGMSLAALATARTPPGPRPPDHRFRPLPAHMTAFHSSEGRRLLLGSERTDEAFWQLTQFYAMQPNLGSCGVASCLAVLNALPVPRPVSRDHPGFPINTSDNFYSEEVVAVLTPDYDPLKPPMGLNGRPLIRPEYARFKVKGSGMTLDQFTEVLRTRGVIARREYASMPEGIKKFRADLREALAEPDRFVVVNFLRSSLGQETSGHLSPVGAYNIDHDAVLVLDTAVYKYSWAWVSVDRLWRAMSCEDDDNLKHPRGYVIVSAKPS